MSSYLVPALFWIGIVLLGLALFMIIVRIIRRFIHFPIPSVIAQVIDNPVRRLMQPPKQVIEWIGIEKGMRILEIGPGPGTFTIEAAIHAERGQVLAVDIQPAVISTLLKRLCKENIANVVAMVASAYELPFSADTFDCVFMVTVLAEIPDRKRALHEIKRLLRKSGFLAIGEFLPDPDYPRQKTVISWCKEAGFKLVDEHRGVFHYVLKFQSIS